MAIVIEMAGEVVGDSERERGETGVYRQTGDWGWDWRKGANF